MYLCLWQDMPYSLVVLSYTNHHAKKTTLLSLLSWNKTIPEPIYYQVWNSSTTETQTPNSVTADDFTTSFEERLEDISSWYLLPLPTSRTTLSILSTFLFSTAKPPVSWAPLPQIFYKFLLISAHTQLWVTEQFQSLYSPSRQLDLSPSSLN